MSKLRNSPGILQAKLQYCSLASQEAISITAQTWMKKTNTPVLRDRTSRDCTIACPWRGHAIAASAAFVPKLYSRGCLVLYTQLPIITCLFSDFYIGCALRCRKASFANALADHRRSLKVTDWIPRKRERDTENQACRYKMVAGAQDRVEWRNICERPLPSSDHSWSWWWIHAYGSKKILFKRYCLK